MNEVHSLTMSLTTFRKTGEAVVTPVWFAESNGTIYVGTGVNAGKIKRIRHTERVTLAACTMSGKVTGSEIEGVARVVSEPEEISAAEAALAKKYGVTRSMYYFILNTLGSIRRKPRMSDTYIAIESVTVYADIITRTERADKSAVGNRIPARGIPTFLSII